MISGLIAETSRVFTTAGQKARETSSSIFYKIVEEFAVAWFHTRYYFSDQTHHGARRSSFHFKDFGPLYNFGKREDFRTYVHTLHDPLVLSPFGSGKCFGGSLFAAKTWLETQSITEVNARLKGGIPVEGVRWQALYEQKCQNTLSEKWEARRQVADLAGLSISKIVCDESNAHGLINQLDGLENGVYLMRYVFEDLRKHAVTLIKTEHMSYLVDTSIAIGYGKTRELVLDNLFHYDTPASENFTGFDLYKVGLKTPIAIQTCH